MPFLERRGDDDASACVRCAGEAIWRCPYTRFIVTGATLRYSAAYAAVFAKLLDAVGRRATPYAPPAVVGHRQLLSAYLGPIRPRFILCRRKKVTVAVRRRLTMSYAIFASPAAPRTRCG